MTTVILAGNPQVQGSFGYGINFYGDYTTANQAFIQWAVQNIQGREFSCTVTIGETAMRLSAPSADELQSLIKQLMSAVSAERGFGLR